jgi:hypothetical protein
VKVKISSETKMQVIQLAARSNKRRHAGVRAMHGCVGVPACRHVALSFVCVGEHSRFFSSPERQPWLGAKKNCSLAYQSRSYFTSFFSAAMR